MGTAIGITTHARLLWVKEVMREKRDILAIQTLRNQLMAASFLASTFILICRGLLFDLMCSTRFLIPLI